MSARSYRMKLWLVAVTVGLWTTDLSGQIRLTLKVGAGPISFVAVSPDSKTLATGNLGSNTIKLWDVNTGKEGLRMMGRLLHLPQLDFWPTHCQRLSIRGKGY